MFSLGCIQTKLLQNILSVKPASEKRFGDDANTSSSCLTTGTGMGEFSESENHWRQCLRQRGHDDSKRMNGADEKRTEDETRTQRYMGDDGEEAASWKRYKRLELGESSKMFRWLASTRANLHVGWKRVLQLRTGNLYTGHTAAKRGAAKETLLRMCPSCEFENQRRR
ncbi:MAG: uncharacterized protein A8A55_2820, partial [Amphiamblys sp. WSBS2006]